VSLLFEQNAMAMLDQDMTIFDFFQDVASGAIEPAADKIQQFSDTAAPCAAIECNP